MPRLWSWQLMCPIKRKTNLNQINTYIFFPIFTLCMQFLFRCDLSVWPGFEILNIYAILGTNHSVFSHWCGFGKHTCWLVYLYKNIFRGGWGLVYERKKTSIFVCQRRLDTMGILNGTMRYSCKSTSGVQIRHVGWSVPRRSGHVWGRCVCLVPLLIFCLCGSQDPAASSRSSPFTAYLC